MTTILVDHDMEGHALLLWATLAADGWPQLASLQLVTLAQVGIPIESSDRLVWRFAQEQRMLLLTNNRNAAGPDSLEQAIREESTGESLPVLTVSTVERLVDREYRERCAERLVEVALYIERYLGTGRLFIP